MFTESRKTLAKFSINRSMSEALIARAEVEAKHASMRSSADLCIEQARHFQAEGDFRIAANNAVCSLEYSIGIFRIVSAIEAAAEEGRERFKDDLAAHE